MSEYLIFNRKLTDMLEDLEASFPDVPEFSAALSPAARLLLSMDPRQAQHLFRDYVQLPYEAQILSRDEAFLLAQTSFGPAGLQDMGDVVALLKRVWRLASAENREAIWRHLHVLLILSRRCMSLADAAPVAHLVTDEASHDL